MTTAGHGWSFWSKWKTFRDSCIVKWTHTVLYVVSIHCWKVQSSEAIILPLQMSAFCKQKPFIFQRMNLISVAVSSSIWNILMNVNTGSHTAFVAADNNLIGFSLSRLFTLGMCWAWVLLFRLCLSIMSLSEYPFSGRCCMKTSSKTWIMSNSRCRERNDDPKRELLRFPFEWTWVSFVECGRITD